MPNIMEQFVQALLKAGGKELKKIQTNNICFYII